MSLDITSARTFSNVQSWLQSVQHSLNFVNKLIFEQAERFSSPRAVHLLVGNKKDIVDRREVTTQQGISLFLYLNSYLCRNGAGGIVRNGFH